VAIDDHSRSKGYGFVQFETERAAQKAIDSVNGTMLEGREVYVGPFQPRAQRLTHTEVGSDNFTNVFVKNFDDKLDSAKLEALFARFGKINSCVVSVNCNGKSKGFGFVAFENPQDAGKAVKEMQDYLVPGSDLKLSVCRAQKKEERLAELKRKHEMLKVERAKRYEGANLYVKNLSDSVDDDILRQSFEVYGKVISAKVMRDNDGKSKGFGFVCFDRPEEAVKVGVLASLIVDWVRGFAVILYTQAMSAMKGAMTWNKPLYVSMAQRKEDRKALIASQYMQRMGPFRQHHVPAVGSGTMCVGNSAGFFVPAPAIQNQNTNSIRSALHSPNSQILNSAAQWNPFIGMDLPGYVMQSRYGGCGSGVVHRTMPNDAGVTAPSALQRHYSWSQAGDARKTQALRTATGVMACGQPGARLQQIAVEGTGKSRTQVGSAGHYQQVLSQSRGIGAHRCGGNLEPLTSRMLSQVHPQQQKRMIGDRIYPLVLRICKGHDAGRIASMLLEMDNAELLLMLENEQLLRIKVNEAISVLGDPRMSASDR
ncbi:unnamed protein product, partial [Toxocara canis]|uniref:Polyadenylate-binding protein n=1 Tax=Toxocara canis TaxID=6265 RepID=A0A183UQE2_TOXCA